MGKYKNKFKKLERRLAKKLYRDIPMAIGREAVNHFRDSFDLQKFNEPGARRWPEVERRKPDSEWYGFRYGNKARRPGVRARKSDGKGNFSRARTTSNIMQVTGKLRDSIHIQSANHREVIIAASAPQAELMNRGGRFLIFGKTPALMPKRQFMGKSTRLTGKIRYLVRQQMKETFRKAMK